MAEIYLLKDTGYEAYESGENPSFVGRCIAEGDPFVKDVPSVFTRTNFHCPVIDRNVFLVGQMCRGPEGSTCEFNRVVDV